MPSSPIKHRPAKSWHKIVVEVDPGMTEAVSAFLADLTDGSIEISAPPVNAKTLEDTTFHADKLSAYILIEAEGPDNQSFASTMEEIEQFLKKLSHIFTDCPSPRLSTDIIMEEDWGEKWKSFFTSFQITPGLIIKPSWEKKYEEKGDDKSAVIEMDPGLAFGTGHHASTQLALLLIEELYRHNKLEQALDIGTGSGILAMACGLFGASQVLAVDNDPDAVVTAQQNILRNHLETIITVTDDISHLDRKFNIIVANITHDILADLAKPIGALVDSGGFLVLSGILKGDQEQSIRNIFTNYGLGFIKSLYKEEWAALQFIK